MDDIAADLDLHIRIRHRIAAVLNARLDWALLLNHQLHESPSHSASPGSFKAAAYDAITTIESPCNLIFDYPLPTPQRQDLRPTRPTTRQKHSANSAPCFLYIRSSALGIKDHNEFYLLKCPQCSRTTFTTLQGLLNHARIAHRLEWGTHEECVRACVVIEPHMDTNAGAEVGLGPTGILPGLRSIFQLAVGAQSNPSTTQLSSQLTKLLGLHEDTPTLAPFLGKAPLRRGIKIYGQDNIISVVGLEHEATTRHWRLPLYPRNEACQQIHDCESPDVVSAGQEGVKPRFALNNPASVALNSAMSRFHFITRIIVTDRSYWIPPNNREGPYRHHSHKWMISVHSPSYAHDLTTILKCLKVTPVHDLDSAVFAFSSPQSPPYVVVGTANSPFLAKIELSFNGVGATELPSSDIQRIVVKHWVELDTLKLSTPVIGEEQTVDIELDKRTLIGPCRNGSVTISSKVLWDIKPTRSEPPNGSKTLEKDDTSECAQILNRLVPLFPMTKESRTGRIVDVPYKLVQTQAQLLSLNLGRRKAIEWKRAKALRDVYLEEILGHDMQERFPILSVGDTYAWLAENGHFIRPFITAMHSVSSMERAIDEENSQYCPVCGLSDDYSTPFPSSDARERCSKTQQRCSSCEVMQCSFKARRLPLVDIIDMIRIPTIPSISGSAIPNLETRNLLQVSSPDVVQAVQIIVETLGTPGFCAANGLSNGRRALTERELAPYALLGLVMQSFVRMLVKGGMEMSRSDDKKKWRRLLTPVHILRGIMVQKDLISKCLAP